MNILCRDFFLLIIELQKIIWAESEKWWTVRLELFLLGLRWKSSRFLSIRSGKSEEDCRQVHEDRGIAERRVRHMFFIVFKLLSLVSVIKDLFVEKVCMSLCWRVSRSLYILNRLAYNFFSVLCFAYLLHCFTLIFTSCFPISGDFFLCKSFLGGRVLKSFLGGRVLRSISHFLMLGKRLLFRSHPFLISMRKC